ncbi:MAG: formate/nitrite transporter family protein [Alphaproteobacteria bacterium]|nr:formate/nitrite transporter family protein [Alphaproteobacteria bacterium]
MPDLTNQPHENFHHDPLLPQEMALKAEQIGVAKAHLDTLSLLTLAVLAGAFIAFGAIFMTVTVAGASEALPYGAVRLLAGLVFSLGLILVVIGGAELFTGNNLMVMAWAGREITLAALLRAWAIVYVGNFVGAIGTAVAVFLSGQHVFGNGAVGRAMLGIADAKAAIPFVDALFLGILCNVLVCLALWLTYSARTVTGKVIVIVPPIAAFVAAGFEHSIANMYFIPAGLLIKWFGTDVAWQIIGAAPGDYAALTLGGFAANLIPVTIGNIVGGGLLVGAVYWFVYLRKR